MKAVSLEVRNSYHGLNIRMHPFKNGHLTRKNIGLFMSVWYAEKGSVMSCVAFVNLCVAMGS